MNRLKLLGAAALLLFSAVAWAQTITGEADDEEQPGTEGDSSGMMMPQRMGPQMMQRMGPMMQHPYMQQMMPQMQGMGPGYGYGMMPGMPMQGMPMQGMPMMGGMMPMMSPEAWQMREQHMAEMQQTLKNIESLLRQILEQQKGL